MLSSTGASGRSVLSSREFFAETEPFQEDIAHGDDGMAAARVMRTSSSRPEAGAWPSVKTPVEKKAAKCPSGQGSFLPSSAWVSCE